MDSFLSRYRPSYVTTLVYMLQAGEYSPREYLSWFHRTQHFGKVARRGKLDPTPKANLLLLFLRAVWLAAAVLALIVTVGGMLTDTLGIALLFDLGLVLLLPYLLAYILVLPLWVGRVLIQGPKQKKIIRQARAKLAKNQAVKIAIAGSYGKTTMKDLLETVIKEGKVVAATPGNYNTPLGISRFIESLVGDEEVLIFELGEYYPGDIATLCDLVRPDLGVITGVNEQHMMRFKSLERTVGTVFELADWLESQPNVGEGREKARLLVNGESAAAAGRAGRYQAVMYDRKGADDWRVSGAKTDLTGTNFTLKRGKDSFNIKAQLLGLHQIGPMVAAAVVAEQLGLSMQQIETGLNAVQPFEHRLQPRLDNEIWTIDDTYNGNPDGFKAAIEFLQSLQGHRRIYVTPGIVELGHATKNVHEVIGHQLAQSGIEVIILIENSAMPYLQTGLKEGGYKGKLMTYPDEITALMALPHLTVAGDVVLLQNDWNDNYA